MVNRCCSCYADGETVVHLFLHCTTASAVWAFFLYRFQRPWVMLFSVKMEIELWSQERLSDLSARGNFLWLCVPTIGCWTLWREQNTRIFENQVMEASKLLDAALSLVFSWVSHIPLFKDIKYVEWVLGWDDLVFSQVLSGSTSRAAVCLRMFSLSFNIYLFLSIKEKKMLWIWVAFGLLTAKNSQAFVYWPLDQDELYFQQLSFCFCFVF